MILPNPPWNLWGAYREAELKRLGVELQLAGVTKYQIKYSPEEKKPYRLWIHDDDLKRAADSLFRKPNQDTT